MKSFFAMVCMVLGSACSPSTGGPDASTLDAPSTDGGNDGGACVNPVTHCAETPCCPGYFCVGSQACDPCPGGNGLSVSGAYCQSNAGCCGGTCSSTGFCQ